MLGHGRARAEGRERDEGEQDGGLHCKCCGVDALWDQNRSGVRVGELLSWGTGARFVGVYIRAALRRAGALHDVTGSEG